MKVKSSTQNEQQTTKTSKLAVVSFILGIVGLFLLPPLTIGAFITGLIAFRNIRTSKLRGKKFAWFGIITFCIQAVLLIVFVSYSLLLSKFQSFQKIVIGENALTVMTQAERTFVETKLKQIQSGFTPEDVKNILGRPRRLKSAFLFRYYYYDCVEPKPSCTVRIDFVNNTIHSYGVIDTERFLYRVKF
jgi:hypothetical protein